MPVNIPNLDLYALSEYRDDDIMISRFSTYLAEHQKLVFPHRHSFYQFVLFTSGGGSHTIDFNHYDVSPSQMYFMIPGQVHSWHFEGEVEGYVVNFSDTFFDSFLLKPDYLDSFSFWNGIAGDSVIHLSDEAAEVITELFENLIRRSVTDLILREDMLRIILLQLFITIEQKEFSSRNAVIKHSQNAIVLNFQRLVEKSFLMLRLPGEYAGLVNVTPNHLNALSREHLGKQAGEVIRERIILEAKRLLVSLDLTVSEIAYKLNFSDNSYFSKFFRKHVGMTPEAFRRKSDQDKNKPAGVF